MSATLCRSCTSRALGRRRAGKPREVGAAAKQTATMRASGALAKVIASMAEANRGGHASSEHRAKISESNHSRVISVKTREKHRVAMRKRWREHPEMFVLVGKARRGVRPDIGRNASFRSSWEANFARILNHIGVGWEFEPTRYELPNGGSYLPDFRLASGTLIEVKGYARSAAMERISLFRQTYPHLILHVVDPRRYGALRGRWAALLSGWEGKC